MQEKKEEILESGSFYFLNLQYKMAIKIYRKGLLLYPNDMDLLFNLGVVYESINDLENAKNCFKEVVSMNKQHIEAQKHLDRIIGK